MAKLNQARVVMTKDNDSGNIVAEIINPASCTGELSSTGKTMVVAYDSDTFGDIRVTVTVTRKVIA